MHIAAHLEVDLVAVEHEDEVALLLELHAPPASSDIARPPATVQVVLDRSGSMHGERLDACCRALSALVARLDPGDGFGLVAFDDAVDVVVPAGPLIDKPAVLAAIERIDAGGSTNPARAA